MNKIVKKITQKGRLAEYERVLQCAINNGYKLISLVDWYQNYRQSNDKVFILRHDIDYDTKGAEAFFKIEQRLGAQATFYFRRSTMKKRIMREMKNGGFEVSLHYETLADYAKAQGIFKKEDVTDDVIEICQQKLSEEIYAFEKKYWKIHTICSHGDKRNRLLEIPNHILINQSIKETHQLLFETYDANIIATFDAYISDSSIYDDFNWKYFDSPAEAIKQDKKTICLLTHPVHWNQSFLNNIKMLVKVYLDNRR